VITKVLIANRGEIALRVARACRELGISTVAVYSTADRDSAAVRFADQAVHIGPDAARQSYLHVPALIEAAHQHGADAVHPGYGFLSEDPDFAEICTAEGLTFIGPPPDVMHRVGDKAVVRGLMADAGLPVLPGTAREVATAADGVRIAARIGYPVIIKAAAGGGGRGMSVVHDPARFEAEFELTRQHARVVFGSPAVYVERFLAGARHVEVQVLCDQHGHGVYLGERDCSIQRRHQKLLEESPCGRLDPAGRERLGELAVRGALAVGFTGAGTMEFLLDDHGDVWFMELNARIQVEHPVTEMLTGIDLVREQLLVSSGLPLGFEQAEIRHDGAAIECRVNAEDPARGFAPAPGLLTRFTPPSGPWTRVDTGYREGDRVSASYDSLLAKVIVWAPDRQQAIARMDRALTEFEVAGPGLATTLDLHRALLRNPTFRRDTHTAQFLDRHLPRLLQPGVALLRPTRPDGEPAMTTTTFTTDDLLALLTVKAGLPPETRAEDPDVTLEGIGLDSLAFLALQTELQDRYGFELPDDRPVADYRIREIAADIDERLRVVEPRAAAS
jgi:acetyl-CoA carboxylase biotin carboxylase subunit